MLVSEHLKKYLCLQYQWTCYIWIFTGCLFHGLKFESQQELSTEKGSITWQVTKNGSSHEDEQAKNEFMQACQRTCYATEECTAFQYSMDDSRYNNITHDTNILHPFVATISL